MFVDRKIFPRNTNTTATAAQSNTTKAIAAIGDFFTGGVVVPKFVIAVGTSRLPAFCPVMINCTSSVEGDCGTMILWKHVGHSIIVLLRHDSHLICWPQTGQTNLNSLMLLEKHSIFVRHWQRGFSRASFPRLCD
jgi:hypothetical protein